METCVPRAACVKKTRFMLNLSTKEKKNFNAKYLKR